MRRLWCAVLALAVGVGCRGEQVGEQRLALEGSGWGSGAPDAGEPDAGDGSAPDGGGDGSAAPDGGMSLDAGVVDAPVADAPHDGPPGTIPYDGGTGRKTWWKDTDGVIPELAGCHVEYEAQGCTSDLQRSFGEMCQDGNTLIETNPGAGICHDHAGDIGHPYAVPCDKWCKNEQVIQTPDGPVRRGAAAAGGRCQIVAYLPCENLILDSARCLCDGTDVQPPEGYPGN